ncbi:hypothetical protein EUGRSUZ_E03883 [Eucalyptus grandis]|uniref:Uncharacterized protein n=2 Tax=Eucalyptus grandis TaxID=71139 RepID=A0ACC3L0U6_EUCGR|nr:hypothetical protein EUGRSUZ_E03883 [Eucalyptus grandis]
MLLFHYYNGEKRSRISFRRSSTWMCENKVTPVGPLMVVSYAHVHKNIRQRDVFFLPIIIIIIGISRKWID